MTQISELNEIGQQLADLLTRVNELSHSQQELRELLLSRTLQKEWYSTGELADLMGVKQFTVQERWCNQGRIVCEKDPDSGKWRIPGHEVERLRNGGSLRTRRGPI